MSTLLKKKYLIDSRMREKMEVDTAVSAAESCKRKLLWQEAEEASSQTSSSSCRPSATTVTAAVPAKAVSFDEEVTCIPATSATGERLDAETLQRYRNDIWYTVRFVFWGIFVMPFCV